MKNLLCLVVAILIMGWMMGLLVFKTNGLMLPMLLGMASVATLVFFLNKGESDDGKAAG